MQHEGSCTASTRPQGTIDWVCTCSRIQADAVQIRCPHSITHPPRIHGRQRSKGRHQLRSQASRCRRRHLHRLPKQIKQIRFCRCLRRLRRLRLRLCKLSCRLLQLCRCLVAWRCVRCARRSSCSCVSDRSWRQRQILLCLLRRRWRRQQVLWLRLLTPSGCCRRLAASCGGSPPACVSGSWPSCCRLRLRCGGGAAGACCTACACWPSSEAPLVCLRFRRCALSAASALLAALVAACCRLDSLFSWP